jgi:dimethylaniline monooxygenase (N-oxide forming)
MMRLMMKMILLPLMMTMLLLLLTMTMTVLLQVVLATGYIFGFPFLDKRVVEVKDNRLPFFKYMFPPDLTHPTLAVIGCFQPLGAIMPAAELQCRLAARVFKVSNYLRS